MSIPYVTTDQAATCSSSTHQSPLIRAATAIQKADFLLVAAGAGMSADSGLSTFAKMTAKLSELLGEGITYDHAAGSDTMVKNPSLFYGFWFASTQSYEIASPHEGYKIIQKWCTDVQARSEVSPTAGSSRRVHVLTSNVDCFFERIGVVDKDALTQVHGSIRFWQCGGVPSGKAFPLFARPRCGDTLFDQPPADGMDYGTMRYHGSPPRCPLCKDGWLRPNIYLFGDGNRFVDKEEATRHQAFLNWKGEILGAMRRDIGLRLVIVEIGCGLRVPNIRKRTEEFFAESPSGQAELIRVNPEHTHEQFKAKPTVFIQAPALSAIEQIQCELQNPANNS